LSLASECAFAGPQSFEPFPSFLLLNKEIRSKRGYLDNIAEAKKSGVTGDVKKTNDMNKDLKTIRALYKYLEPIQKISSEVSNDEELKKYLLGAKGILEKEANLLYKYI